MCYCLIFQYFLWICTVYMCFTINVSFVLVHVHMYISGKYVCICHLQVHVVSSGWVMMFLLCMYAYLCTDGVTPLWCILTPRLLQSILHHTPCPLRFWFLQPNFQSALSQTGTQHPYKFTSYLTRTDIAFNIRQPSTNVLNQLNASLRLFTFNVIVKS